MRQPRRAEQLREKPGGSRGLRRDRASTPWRGAVWPIEMRAPPELRRSTRSVQVFSMRRVRCACSLRQPIPENDRYCLNVSHAKHFGFLPSSELERRRPGYRSRGRGGPARRGYRTFPIRSL